MADPTPTPGSSATVLLVTPSPAATATVTVTVTSPPAQTYPPADTSPAIITAAIIAICGVALTGLITYLLGRRNSTIAQKSADTAKQALTHAECSSKAAEASSVELALLGWLLIHDANRIGQGVPI